MTIQIIGHHHPDAWAKDPKHLVFTLARYKFVAKMLAGMDRVLEVGCGDCTGAPIVASHVKSLLATDRNLTNEQLDRLRSWHSFEIARHDIMSGGPLGPAFDGCYALDVLEHIDPVDEDWFLGNIYLSLKPHGTLIVGMPSLESQPYASEKSRAGHVNCKTEEGLREALERHFHCVYLFGMNDESLHTGYGPLCHYRLAIANTPRVRR